MKELLDKLTNEFSDRDYAHAYMESHAVSRIAAQIHAIRKQRGWSQIRLAHEAGIAQERVSKIESADFDSLTMKTLQKFARAFDCHLNVSYVPFSKGILDTTNLSPERLTVHPREQDLAACKRKSFKVDVETGTWQSVTNIEEASPGTVDVALDDAGIHYLNTQVMTRITTATGPVPTCKGDMAFTFKLADHPHRAEKRVT